MEIIKLLKDCEENGILEIIEQYVQDNNKIVVIKLNAGNNVEPSYNMKYWNRQERNLRSYLEKHWKVNMVYRANKNNERMFTLWIPLQ